MLNGVTLTHFRGFQHYRMDSLSRVNLLVGKNNSGKTSILEGLHFLASGGDPGCAGTGGATARRGNSGPRRAHPESGELTDIAHFFTGIRHIRIRSFESAILMVDRQVDVGILDRNSPARAYGRPPSIRPKISYGNPGSQKELSNLRLDRLVVVRSNLGPDSGSFAGTIW